MKKAGVFIAATVTETLLGHAIGSAYQEIIRQNKNKIETVSNKNKFTLKIKLR